MLGPSGRLRRLGNRVGGSRFTSLRSRLAGLEADIAAGRVRLCFESKRLWRKQHHLEQNGYANHEECLQDRVVAAGSPV